MTRPWSRGAVRSVLCKIQILKPIVTGRREKDLIMTTHQCPRCRKQSLVQTGIYWSCADCQYAITHSALLIERGGFSRYAGYSPLHPNAMVDAKRQ